MKAQRLTAERILDALANPAVVAVNAAKPFPHAYDTTHTWTESIACQYLEEVIELPQYKSIFLKIGINGYSLLCLDESTTRRCCDIGDTLHAAKVALHADNLRRQVFQTARKNLPPTLRDWHPVHIAALLQSRYNCPNGCVRVLRRQLDGNTLASMTLEDITAFVSKLGCTEDESTRIVEGLNEILEAHLALIKGRTDKEHQSSQPRMAPEYARLMNEDPPDSDDGEEQEVGDDDDGGDKSVERGAEGEVGGDDLCEGSVEEGDQTVDAPHNESVDGEGGVGGDEEEEEEAHSDLDEDLPRHLRGVAATPASGSGNGRGKVDMDTEKANVLSQPNSNSSPSADRYEGSIQHKSSGKSRKRKKVWRRDLQESTKEDGGSSKEVGGKGALQKSDKCDEGEGGVGGDEEEEEEAHSDLDEDLPRHLRGVAATPASGSGKVDVDTEKANGARNTVDDGGVKSSEIEKRRVASNQQGFVRTQKDQPPTPPVRKKWEKDRIGGVPDAGTKTDKETKSVAPHPEPANTAAPSMSTVLAQITTLQRVVEDHSGMVRSLQHENKKLRKERERADAFMRETVKEAFASRHREASMVEVERDAALKSLSAISRMYIDDVMAASVEDNDTSGQITKQPPICGSGDNQRSIDEPPAYSDDEDAPSLSNLERTAENGERYEPIGRSMTEELVADADQEAQAWLAVLGTYRYDDPPLCIEKFDDSLTVLRRVAISWMRLGKNIYDDATGVSGHTSGASFNGHSTNELLVHNGCNGCCTGDTDIIIRGLVATVRSSLVQARSWSSSTISITTRKEMTVGEPHCYLFYAGVVFALGLACKILRNIDSGRNSVNMMVSRGVCVYTASYAAFCSNEYMHAAASPSSFFAS